MATTFIELIKTGKVKAAHLDKQTALANISDNVNRIEDLDTSNHKVRAFSRVESNAEKSLDVLKAAITALNRLLSDTKPKIASDEDYLADLKPQRT